MGYFSSFKVLTILKFSGQQTLPRCLHVDHWKLYCQNIRKKKNWQANKARTSLFGSYDSATVEDLKAMSTVTFWSGDLSAAMFFLFVLLSSANYARGNEVRIDFIVNFITSFDKLL